MSKHLLPSLCTLYIPDFLIIHIDEETVRSSQSGFRGASCAPLREVEARNLSTVIPPQASV